VRAVLLDALGTLVALRPPWLELERRLRAEHGLRLAPGDAERAFRAEIAYYRAHHCEGSDTETLADLRRRCAAVLRRELPAAIRDALTIEQVGAAMLACLRFEVYPDARATLPALRARGLKLVVVSNWDVSLPAVLGAAGLADMLDGVLTSAAVGAPKPSVAIFEAALALAGVAPERAVHVGDSLAHDVLGARAAGIAPVLLRRAGASDTQADADVDVETDVAAARRDGVPVIASLAGLLA
jgi:putative hydrolase of the HAD superfamily